MVESFHHFWRTANGGRAALIGRLYSDDDGSEADLSGSVAEPRMRDESGVPVVNSRDVAEVFGKRHGDVLKAVRNLECSEDFTARSFAAST
jgi:hypothetical protein